MVYRISRYLFRAESFALVIQDLKRGESHEKNELGHNDGNKLGKSRNKCKYAWLC